MKFNECQLQAIEKATTQPFQLITGAAGTGKTTIVEEIMKRLGPGTALLAPTGKAAARLKEVTGYYAETIHRWLGWDGFGTTRTEANNNVVIDESSMIDSWLLAKVLRMRTPPKRLILVGDASQLPPVGKGQPFHQLLLVPRDRVSVLAPRPRPTGVR